jgi:hypothetical protein
MIEGVRKKLIVVLGMHRSGTSAVTRGLQVVGVELGETLLPEVDWDNAKGYWEDIEINALNIEMLKAIDRNWFDLSLIEKSDIELLVKKGFLLRAVELLRKKIKYIEIYGFKDPRVAILLDFWARVFEHCDLDVSYVLVIRHPLSVVKSLAKRGGIEIEQSYYLWLTHIVSSLTGYRENKLIVVDYDQLMRNPDSTVTRMANNLDLRINQKEMVKYKGEFLDSELQHSTYDMRDLLIDDRCPSIVSESYSELLEIASEKKSLDDVAVQNKIKSWLKELERIKPSLQLVDRLIYQKKNITVICNELTQCNTVLTKKLSDSDTNIVNIGHLIASRDLEIDELKKAIYAKEVHINNLDQIAAVRASEINSYVTQQEKLSNAIIYAKKLGEK